MNVAATYENGSSTIEVDSAPVKFYVASFSVKTNSWSPNPAYVGEIVSGQVQGNLDPSSLDGGGSGPDFVIYSWTTAGVWYSQDGTAGSFEPYGGDAIVAWTQGQASTTFSAQFGDPGQYLLEVQCTATVYSQTTGGAGAVFTQTGYIGGDASDIDQSGGGSGHAMKAQGRVAHAGGGGAGITVVPATVTFSDTSLIKLGLGAPTAYWKQITATVMPPYQADAVQFAASNSEVSVAVPPGGVDPITGTVALDITAVSATPVTPATEGGVPDCNITANGTGGLLQSPVASLPVIVYTPASIGTPHPTYHGEVHGQNVALDGSTTPAYTYLQPGQVYLTTIYKHDMTITVFDQFSHALDAIYSHAPVEEFNEGEYVPINQEIGSDGTYTDPVGIYNKGGEVVYKTDAIALKWSILPILIIAPNTIGVPIPADINVAVSNIPLNPSIVGRTATFTYGLGSVYDEDIDWP